MFFKSGLITSFLFISFKTTPKVNWGRTCFSENYDTLYITFGVNGTKHEHDVRSKMDVVAHRNDEQWRYSSIHIRIKKPEDLKRTMEIVKQES